MTIFRSKYVQRTKYDNFRRLNINRYSYHVNVEKCVRHFCREMGFKGKKYPIQLNVLLCELFHCYVIDKEQYLSYSQDTNQYKAKSRYNPYDVSFRVFVKITKKLAENEYDYIEQTYGKNYTHFKRAPKMKATDHLIQIMEQKFNISMEMIQRSPNEEIIILRNVKEDKKGNKVKFDVEYDDKEETILMREKLRAYNDLIAKTHIDVNTHNYKWEKKRSFNKKGEEVKLLLKIDYTNKMVKRIFNNGTFTNGGRFYGGFWLSIPSKLRQRILINGENVAEPDYSGIHIHFLYFLNGITLGDKEPYIIKKGENDTLRGIYKRLLLTAVNCQSDESCCFVVHNELLEQYEEADLDTNSVPSKKQLMPLLQKLKAHHKEIAHLLNTGIGIELMVWDSDIAEEIMFVLTQKRIPVLCIHDGFICRISDQQLVEQVMKTAYIKIINREMLKLGLEFRLHENDVRMSTDRDFADSKSLFKGSSFSRNKLNNLTIIRDSQIFRLKHAIRYRSFISSGSAEIIENDIIEPTYK